MRKYSLEEKLVETWREKEFPRGEIGGDKKGKEQKLMSRGSNSISNIFGLPPLIIRAFSTIKLKALRCHKSMR